MEPYDPRYLAGILFFNAQDFFEAHEVWEDLWSESHGDVRRFVQGLIQAAVGLYHFGRGNRGGAAKLYRTSRQYMSQVGSPFWGLDVTDFWRRTEECFRPLLESPATDPTPCLDPAKVPTITIEPPPESWPNAADYIEQDDD